MRELSTILDELIVVLSTPTKQADIKTSARYDKFLSQMLAWRTAKLESTLEMCRQENRTLKQQLDMRMDEMLANPQTAWKECPKCKRLHATGYVCYFCGYEP